eukprot:6185216-Ditylum_brightwellii.AAC.1
MSLRTPVMNSVKPHVNCTHAVLFYCGIKYAARGGVVSEDRCGGLGMAHLDKGKAQFFSLARVG